MFDSKDEIELDKPKKKKSKSGKIEILPLRDFHIVCNSDNIVIVEGEKIEVPSKYLANLKTEKVI